MKKSFEKTMIMVDKKLGIGCLLETMCLFVAFAGILLTIVFVLMSPSFFSADDVQAESHSLTSSASPSVVVTTVR